MNFGLRSRYVLYQNENVLFNNKQLDLVHFSTLKLNLQHTISLGIQYRFRDLFDEGDDELRLTQQFNIIKRIRATRYGHRLRAEQRFFQFFTTFRFRYRFTFDVPLKGSTLNIRESYWVQSFEGVASYTKAFKPTYDLRTTAQLGWLLAKYFKFQIGLEYRIESFNVATLHRIFLLTTAVCKV